MNAKLIRTRRAQQIAPMLSLLLFISTSAVLGQTWTPAEGERNVEKEHGVSMPPEAPPIPSVPEYLLDSAKDQVPMQKSPVDPSISLEGMSTKGQPGDLTPGYVIIDGDIQVRAEDFDSFLEDQTRAVFGTVNYWGNTVPYDFAANVNATNQQNAIGAMNAIGARVGITFRARLGGDPDWVRFNASTFNNSPVGRQGGQQIINIVSWGTQIIIVHELYHSLGFWHEQSASDRDTYVTINFGNVCGSSGVPGDPCNPNVCQGCANSGGTFISCAFNFNITSGAAVWGPYDFDSFMHYGRTAFSCNGGDTITVNPTWNAQWQSLIGQRDHYGLLDELSCRGIYPYAGDRWLRAGAGGSNVGTFFNPFIGTFATACNSTPQNGTLLIDPGTYSGVGTYSQAKTIRATYGVATIGN
jgi:hypothetical protein